MEVLQGPVHLQGTLRPEGPHPASWWVTIDGAVRWPPRPVGSESVDLALAGLELSDGLHTVDLVLGATRPGVGLQPVARRTYYARVQGDRVEVLAPGTGSRYVRRSGAPRAAWEDAPKVPEIAVEPALVR